MRGHLSRLLAVAAVVLLTSSVAVAAPAAAAVLQTGAAAATAGQPVYAFNTGLVLTVSSTPARGATVRVRANKGTTGQKWVVSGQTLRPAADQKLCLNVPSAKFRAGAKLQLWTCNGHAGENFSSKVPSAHTSVYFLRPSAKTSFCVTALNAPPNESASLVGLESCAGLSTQAWSHANLDGVAGTIGDEFGIQALHPATAGSAVTGDNHFANQLNQFWTSTTSAGHLLLHPVEDTALCAGLASSESDGVALQLASCNGSASQQFTGIGVIFNQNYTWAYLATADSEYCVQAAASGSESARSIVLGGCVGNDRDLWDVTVVNVTTTESYQFQELYAGTSSLQFSMRVTGNGGAGSEVKLSADDQAAAQVWTDLAPGQTTATGNPDGSITLRPLSDEKLCLTVPGANYAAGTQLTVQACNGAVDQEFARGLPNEPTDLVAAGSGDFCVTAAGAIAAGSPIELEPCAALDDQTWSTFFDWYGWASSAD